MDKAFRLPPGSQNLSSEKMIKWIRVFIVAVTVINIIYLYYEMAGSFGQNNFIFNLSLAGLVVLGIFLWFAIAYFYVLLPPTNL